MNRAMVILRCLAGTVFVYAGALKVWNPDLFKEDILNYRLVPYQAAVAAALYLPWLEIACGLATIFRIERLYRGALFILSGLMILFVTAYLSTLLRGIDIECGCFGKLTRSWQPWQILLRGRNDFDRTGHSLAPGNQSRTANGTMNKALILDFDGLIGRHPKPAATALGQSFTRSMESCWNSPTGSRRWGMWTTSILDRIWKTWSTKASTGPELDIKIHLRQCELVADQPLMPGVESLLSQAVELDYRLGIASNAPAGWVERHLRNHNLPRRLRGHPQLRSSRKPQAAP